MQEVKDHLYDRNMPLSCDNVELRRFEPLTSCMPYKIKLWLDVAECGSTSSFNRCMSLDVAPYRRSLAPRLAPLPGFSGAASPEARPQETEPKLRSYCPSGLARRLGRLHLRGNRPDARRPGRLPPTRQRAASLAGTTIHARPTVSHSSHPSTPQALRGPGMSGPPEPGRHSPRRYPDAPDRRPARPDSGPHRGITHAIPVLLHAARHEQARRP
jgi:hypothetical protein